MNSLFDVSNYDNLGENDFEILKSLGFTVDESRGLIFWGTEKQQKDAEISDSEPESEVINIITINQS